jgi:hypothetical protein
VEGSGLGVVRYQGGAIDEEGADRVPPQPLRGTSVEEARIFISLNNSTEFPALLPVSSTLEDQALQGRPAKHTQRELVFRKRTAFLEQVKQVNQERAVVLVLGVIEVGAFPDLGGVAERFKASGEVPGGVRNRRECQ